MSATSHSPTTMHVPFHGKAALVLAVLAAVGVLAEANTPTTAIATTVTAPTPKTVRAIRPVLDAPVAAYAGATDRSKTPLISAEPSTAATPADAL